LTFEFGVFEKNDFLLFGLLILCYLNLAVSLTTFEYNPVANVEATVVIGRARVTLLSSNLVRVEVTSNNASNPVFDDRATTAVVNRNLPVPDFTINHINETAATITTSTLSITYVDSGGSQQQAVCTPVKNETDVVNPVRSRNYPNGVPSSSLEDCAMLANLILHAHLMYFHRGHLRVQTFVSLFLQLEV